MKPFVFSVLLCALLLLPPVVRGQDISEPEAAPTTNQPALAADSAALVKKGKMPAYFDANDLSRPPVISGVSAILMDAETRQVLYEQNADARREPASTTKILTGLIFAENVKPGEIVVCKDASLQQLDESLMHVAYGEKFKADDLLKATLVRSANDGAALMAERVAGTNSKFAILMNARARKLGAFNSSFVTPNGLHDPNHYSTARDIALIACAAMKNPRLAEAVRLPECTIERSIRKNEIRFVARAKRKFHAMMPDADGVKSGYTRQARYCFVGSVTRDGRRLLAAVLGSENSTADCAALINWGFARFPAMFMARQGQVVTNIPIRDGELQTVPAIAVNNLYASTDSLNSDPRFVIKPVLRPLPSLFAPVRKGQFLGYLIAYAGNKPVAKTALKAARTVSFSSSAAAKRVIGQMIPYIGGAFALVGGYWWYRHATTSTKNHFRRRTYVP